MANGAGEKSLSFTADETPSVPFVGLLTAAEGGGGDGMTLA